MKSFAFLFLLCVSSTVFAKRLYTPVSPVVTPTSKIDFELHRNDCKDGKGLCELDVFLVSKDLKTEKVGWKSELYKREFKEGVETDVQEILPKSLKLRRHHVVARDERNRLYVVDINSGALVRPKQPIIYPADK